MASPIRAVISAAIRVGPEPRNGSYTRSPGWGRKTNRGGGEMAGGPDRELVVQVGGCFPTPAGVVAPVGWVVQEEIDRHSLGDARDGDGVARIADHEAMPAERPELARTNV